MLARQALEKIPEFYFSKLSVAAMVLPGEEKYENARKQKWLSLECLVEMMAELCKYYLEIGKTKEAEEEKTKAEALIRLFEGQGKSSRWEILQRC